MPRHKKPIAIALTDLVAALEDHSGLAWYLDTRTGDVLPVPDDADDDLRAWRSGRGHAGAFTG